MTRLPHWVARSSTVLALLALGGCTTTTAVLAAAGVATDTSVTWSVVKHVHAQLTDGDAPPCARLGSVERALNPRCGAFERGSLRAKDLSPHALGECALTMAARDTRLWPVLPELIAIGAQPEACAQPPLVALAQANECPDMGAVPGEVRGALAWLAQVDARAIQHDVVRWLSCPNSRAARLDAALDTWLAAGALAPGSLSFSPLAALHPSHLGSAFARGLEASGHSAAQALGAYAGQREHGFELALRSSDYAALDWWLARQPRLANRVPPRQGNQLSWLPLARVLVPNFLAHPDTRADMVAFLMARGANPQQRLPSNPNQTVADMALAMKSPLANLLAAGPQAPQPTLVVSANGPAGATAE